MTATHTETHRPGTPPRVEEAIAAIARGEMVVVTDDDDREHEGDLVMAADLVTSEALTFMIVHGRGLICLAMTGADAQSLSLAPMVADSEDHMGTAFTISIDGTPATGVTTGISARDRTETIRRAVSGKREYIQRPGHVFPLVAVPGGVLTRRGHTEAAVDLARCAGRQPMGVIVEIIGDDGEMLRGAALTRFAAHHGLVQTSIDALSRHLRDGAAHGVR